MHDSHPHSTVSRLCLPDQSRVARLISRVRVMSSASLCSLEEVGGSVFDESGSSFASASGSPAASSPSTPSMEAAANGPLTGPWGSRIGAHGSNTGPTGSASAHHSAHHTPHDSLDLTSMSHSLPTSRGRLSSVGSAGSLLAASGGFLDDALFHDDDIFALSEAPRTKLSSSVSANVSVNPALTHSHTTNNLRAAPTWTPSPTDWPRSGTTAIPIHPTSRPRACSHALPSALAASPASATPPPPSSSIPTPSPSPTPSPAAAAAAATSSSLNVAVAKPPRRSWSLIEHGRRLWGGSKKDKSKDASAGPPPPAPSVPAMDPALATGWPAAARAPHPREEDGPRGRARSLSFTVSPLSSAVDPIRTFLSCSALPSAKRADVQRVYDHLRALDAAIESHKALLTRLWTRRRQVLGTLDATATRLASCMHAMKLAALQELRAVQQDLFDQDEAMLRHACIILKERQAAARADAEEMRETLIAVAQVITEHSVGGSKGRRLAAAVTPMLVGCPPASLLGVAAEGAALQAAALAHPLIASAAREHRNLVVRLDACKARYLAATRATEVEELAPRRQRYQRVVRAMVQAQAQSTPAPATPEPGAENDTTPPPMSHAAVRDVELDFARLLLDERTSEGRAVLQLVMQLDQLLVKREAVVAATAAAATAAAIVDTTDTDTLTAEVTASTTPDEAATITPSPQVDAADHLDSMVQSPEAVESNSSAESVVSAAALHETDSPLALNSTGYDLLGTLLVRLESSLVHDAALPQSHRGALRVLLQRVIFPRVWHVVTRLGYEPEDARCLPELPLAYTTGGGEDAITASLSPSPSPSPLPVPPPTLDEDEMSHRERVLDAQLAWLRRIPPADFGVPDMFLRSATPAPVATPRTSFSLASAPGTPLRAPPTHKPSLPPAASPSPSPTPSPLPPPTLALALASPPVVSAPTPASSPLVSLSSTPLRAVVDLFEELGGLSAPSDMVACLLAASKAIYTAAARASDLAAKEKHARGEPMKPKKAEALGADSFFPLFLTAMVHASVPAWLHRLKLMHRYALTAEECMAEPAYYLTTLEAALIFVQQATPAAIRESAERARNSDQEEKNRKMAEADMARSENNGAANDMTALPANEKSPRLLEGGIDTKPDPNTLGAFSTPHPTSKEDDECDPHRALSPIEETMGIPGVMGRTFHAKNLFDDDEDPHNSQHDNKDEQGTDKSGLDAGSTSLVTPVPVVALRNTPPDAALFSSSSSPVNSEASLISPVATNMPTGAPSPTLQWTSVKHAPGAHPLFAEHFTSPSRRRTIDANDL